MAEAVPEEAEVREAVLLADEERLVVMVALAALLETAEMEERTELSDEARELAEERADEALDRADETVATAVEPPVMANCCE